MSPPAALAARRADQALRQRLPRPRRPRPRGPRRRLLRPARPQRRGQDDAHQRRLQPHPRHRRRDRASSATTTARTPRARLVGLAEQDVNLDRFLDVEETLLYHGGYYGMDRARARRRAGEMMDVFDLRAKAHVRAPMLSGGMRRRLLLARALMHEPRLVILDEPTAGVDFELRLELWAYIRRLHGEGTTILLTTHYLEEAEELCEEIALIRGGRLLARDSADGPARRLRGRLAGRRLRQGDGVVSARWPRRHRGLLALSARETHRVLKLWTQTVAAPILSSFLFILVFGLSLGGRIKQIDGVDYEVFIVPGLITMAMIQATYANNSASVFQARFDRYLNDVLAAPMRPWEVNLALSIGGVVRALLIGARPAGLRAAGRRRARAPAARARRSRCAGARALLVVRRDRRHLRQLLGPHGVRDQHRHPAADLPRRRLLLGRPPARAVARDQPRQPDLLPAQRGALRLPGHERRERRARARGDRRARGGHGGVELMAVRTGHRLKP